MQQRRRVRNRPVRRRAGAKGSAASVMGRLFAVYLALAVTAGGVIIAMKANQMNAIPASAASPAQNGGSQPLSLVERLRNAAERVFNLVRPASARGVDEPAAADDDRMRSFGDRLVRAVLDTMGGLDPEDPRTMIRAELPLLMKPEIPAAPVAPRAEAVAARSAELRSQHDSLEAAAVPVEPWAASTADASTGTASPAVAATTPTATAGSAGTSGTSGASAASTGADSSKSGNAAISMSAAEEQPAASSAPVSTASSAPAKQAAAPPATDNRTSQPASTTRTASPSSGPQVAILHTHSSEAYRASQGTDYCWGKTDGVVKVGAVLAEELKKAGVNAIHSTKVHDYPNWTKSYAAAAATIRSLLDKNPGIDAVIDVHRDAVPTGSGSLKPVTIAGQKCARVIFIVSDESSGLAHPNWRANYAFALKLSAALDKVAPGLSRGVAIHKGGRFNQQMHDHAIIVEIGGTTNTLEEATRSAKYVARAIAAVL